MNTYNYFNLLNHEKKVRSYTKTDEELILQHEAVSLTLEPRKTMIVTKTGLLVEWSRSDGQPSPLVVDGPWNNKTLKKVTSNNICSYVVTTDSCLYAKYTGPCKWYFVREGVLDIDGLY